MIGPAGLLLVVPMKMQVPDTILLVGLPQKKTARLTHVVLLSRVTY